MTGQDDGGALDAPRWSGRAVGPAGPAPRASPPPPDARRPLLKPGLPAGAVAETLGDAGHTGPLALADADVLAAARGDRAAFARIYDRYSARLYDFCVGMVRDPHAAADCVQDTFCLAAERLTQLREPDKLRPWLYAIARHEALRRIRARTRERATDELPDRSSPDSGPATLAGRYDLVDLVTEAAGGLSERDRAVLDLHYRHGLDGPELAGALGVSHTAANTMVGRLRVTVERSLGALLVARKARHDPGRCVALDAILVGWDGRMTVLMRKRVARHLDQCPGCDGMRRELVDPRTLLASAPLVLPAPLWLRHDVLAATTGHLHTAAHGLAATTTSWWPAAKIGVLGHLLHGLHAVPLAVAAPLVAVTVAVPVVVVVEVHHTAAPPAAVAVRNAADESHRTPWTSPPTSSAHHAAPVTPSTSITPSITPSTSATPSTTVTTSTASDSSAAGSTDPSASSRSRGGGRAPSGSSVGGG